MEFKKILVPVDFSEFSDKAVEYALTLAEKFCADITLLHAIVLFREDFDEEDQLQAYRTLVFKQEKEKSKKLASRCQKIQKKGIKIHSAVQRGFSESETILDYIRDHRFDLMVMGTQGRTGWKKLLLGSVTETVVRKAEIPVLTVHKDSSPTDFRRILVPVDFTEHSPDTINLGKELARRFKSRLDFLHVVETRDHPEFYSISFQPILKANPGLKDHITKNLKELSGTAAKNVTHSVREGKVYKEINAYVEEKGIDLIVMGTNTVHELDEILMGSNSERVLRITPCPVITIKRDS